MSFKQPGINLSSSQLSSASRRRRSRAPQFSVDALEPRRLFAAALPTIGIYATLPSASETDPKHTGHGEFTVRRTGSTAKALSFSYYIYKATTATAGVDYYNTLTGNVTIRAGATSAFFNLYPIDDSIHEPDELVVIAIRPITGYAVAKDKAVVTIHDNDPIVSATNWFDNTRHSRTALSVNVGSTARTDEPIDRSINFTSILSSLGKSGSLIDNSIRVMEVSADGSTLIDSDVPFQFDKASNYNASTNASGNLVILVKGSTAANTTRHYQIYFDTAGSFAAPSFTSLVSTTSTGITDEGFDSVLISNQVADFYYQKTTGGFSSIVDKNGNDWISWKSTGGSDGEFRGTPNLGAVGFHPGRDGDVTTVVTNTGPLKTTLESTDSQGNKVRWEFYPTFARLTVLSMNQNYWFLYEGTPGGSISSDDAVVESDGTVTNVMTDPEWDHNHVIGQSNGQEWAYVRDADVNGGNGRYIYFVHNTPDNIVDSYYTMEGNMTVLGFDRQNSLDHSQSNPLLSATPNVFTLGLADGGSDFNAASALINGVYRPVTATLGAADSQ